MQARIKQGLILLVLVLLGGCSALKDAQIWKDPEVRVASSRLVGLTLDKALLELDLSVKNPNAYGIQLGALYYGLQLQGARVVSGQQTQGQKLAANASQNLVLPLELEFAELAKLVSGLSQLKVLDYAVEGGMTVEVPLLGPKRLPFSFAGDLPIPRPPSLSLEGVRQQRLGFNGADLVVSLRLDNPNAFDLQIEALDYALALNDQPVTQGKLPSKVALAAGSQSRLDVPVSVSFSRSALALYEILQRGGQMNYRLELDSQIGSSLPLLKSFPFETQQTGQIRLTR